MREQNTDLGGLIVGNFDIVFSEKLCRCVIQVRAKYQFDPAITNIQASRFIQRFSRGARRWNFDRTRRAGQRGAELVCAQAPDCDCCCTRIPIQVRLYRVNDGSEHFTVDVSRGGGRAKVMWDVNVDINHGERTLAHEFGHVLANYDEYPPRLWGSEILGLPERWVGLLPFIGWRISGHEADRRSIMNGYPWNYEFRERHFQHIADWVNSQLPRRRCPYRIVVS